MIGIGRDTFALLQRVRAMIIFMLMVVSAVTFGVGYIVVGAFWDDHQDIKKQMEEAEIRSKMESLSMWFEEATIRQAEIRQLESRSEFTGAERQAMIQNIPPLPKFCEGGYLPLSPRPSYNTDNLPASMLTVDELIRRIESL